jgi:hypothetical protein
VLAGQATVALRNAQMYKEVPFISVLEPVLERKRKFMALEKRRRTLIMILAAAAVIFLAAFCPEGRRCGRSRAFEQSATRG